jgi:carbonic anhydrase
LAAEGCSLAAHFPMKTKSILVPLAAMTAAVFAVTLILTNGRAEDAHAAPAHGAHWSYEGATGPAHWAELDPDCEVCKEGQAQSPIDLVTAAVQAGSPANLDYGNTSLRVEQHEHVASLVDNGHTIQVTVEEGSTFTTSHGTYQLKQFHFHTPSEHTIDGRSFPMEVHFVHQSADGRLAVVGIFFVEGAANANLAKLIAHFPAGSGQSAELPAEKIDLDLHLPKDRTAYTYMGSLTTPPCSEGVEWYVLREPVPASREQLEAFAARLHQNHRPVQPLNGRTVELVTVADKEGD